jgi:hypothetical protein
LKRKKGRFEGERREEKVEKRRKNCEVESELEE